MKKLFGGIDLIWKKVILFAVIAGVYTGVMTLIPAAKDTSFADITMTFEWWVLFGILIIVNSRSAVDSALKCFVFFLISQPLVYLVQVPWHELGWGLFRYYPAWFMWTLCCLPMGFVGYFMKKEKWWSLLILVPMLAFVGYHYHEFLRETVSFFPHHLLSTIFCAVTVILYPLYIFRNKKLRIAGLILAAAILAAMTVFGIRADRRVYSPNVLISTERGVTFDETCEVSLEDPSIGEVYIDYIESIDDCAVTVDCVKLGTTKLILTDIHGVKHVYDLTIERDTYSIREITGNGGETS